MTSPVETIADALIAFIMSLLRDPEAANGFAGSPHAALAARGLSDVCMADVAAVRPVIVDHPSVVHHSSPPPPPPTDPGGDGAVREIVRMIQQYTIDAQQYTTVDARSTILDQSVNQNIWTEGGDVTQVFDQDAVVASGDSAIAAGDDVSVSDSDTDVSLGDVTIGNRTDDDSFNQTGTDPDSDAPAADDPPVDTDADVLQSSDPGSVAAAAPADQAADAAAAPASEPVAPPADVPEPADLLEGDMTSDSTDAYDADATGAALDDLPIDGPVEDD
ncbi:IniB N-terminal domain-containing protein [Microbacterium sp. MAHUQ-60]|uniref:IniB N-terminal domain-containing protein n=1 Tax=unclassified Microbacterium TaxID=2609290 RepID=UPI003620F974